ncbi:hypothetical protein ACHAWT_005769 [Skeletonema menzelii]
MKLILASLLTASAWAFVPSMPRHVTTALSERLDSSDAIQAALDASKKYGAASPEARVLWDIVEEMDSADNTAAFKPAVVDEEYADKVKALSQLLTKTKDELDMVKSLADQLKGVKLAKPTSSSVSGSEDSALKAALDDARSAAEAHGKDSIEAKLAWETVEEIAASNNLEATRAPLDEECLIELIEGCEALEKFKTALDMN